MVRGAAVALPPCPDLTGSFAWSVSLQTTQVPYSNTSTGSNDAPGISWRGAIEFRGGSVLNPGFLAQLWVVSGPGPIYTDEILLVQVTSTAVLNTPVTGFVSQTATLPNAGRVFQPGVDQYNFRVNSQWSPNVPGGTLLMGAEVCGSDAAVDCCAQLNAKLDAVLSFVAQVYSNSP